MQTVLCVGQLCESILSLYGITAHMELLAMMMYMYVYVSVCNFFDPNFLKWTLSSFEFGLVQCCK